MLDATKEYMAQMDSSMNDKELMLNYMVGNTVMDMGCGSGGLLGLIGRKFPQMKRIGMDQDTKFLRNRLGRMRHMGEEENIQLIEDNVGNLSHYVSTGEVDTFIFSSILHEVYSYNNFNLTYVKDVLQQAIRVLPVGGRLIIRDGVKPSTNNDVYIRFVNPGDIQLAFRYGKDFKGRNIKVTTASEDMVLMKEQDAMEFLYTYTWGKEHYEREIQEQYGLWTPKGWIDYVMQVAESTKCDLRLVTYNHYLQEGYNHYLSKRVELTDVDFNKLRLPDSNGLFIFEKE